jgi:hypothetical protein
MVSLLNNRTQEEVWNATGYFLDIGTTDVDKLKESLGALSASWLICRRCVNVDTLVTQLLSLQSYPQNLD